MINATATDMMKIEQPIICITIHVIVHTISILFNKLKSRFKSEVFMLTVSVAIICVYCFNYSNAVPIIRK